MRKRYAVYKKFIGLVLVSFLSVFPSQACKKSPITPDTEELARPIIWLDSLEMSFFAYEAGGNPSPQTFIVKNAGKGQLDYTITDDSDWLSVEPDKGSSSGQVVEHTIFIDISGLSAQEDAYTAIITIQSPQAYNNPQKISVNLNISQEPPPQIWIDPAEMSFAAAIGSDPSSQTLRVKNVGRGTLNYTISWDAGWMTVNPASGSSTGQENSHTVIVNSSSLGAGNYSGTITVASAGATNSPQRVSVRLDVMVIPTGNQIYISCSPSSGGTGTTVSIPVSISGNLKEITSFGLDMTFDSGLFQYLSTNKGSLTGNWSMLDGNLVGSGLARLGGFAGSGNSTPIGSAGSIAVVTLRVIGTAYNDGHQSQITIKSYEDDIVGMKTEPTSTVFTFRK